MKNLLKNCKSTNLLDDLIKGLIDNMEYSDNTIKYPDISKCNCGEVPPELFYKAYAGLEITSEKTAIQQYISSQTLHEKLGTLFLGVAITEMQHLDKLGDLIIQLGGTIKLDWNNKNVNGGSNPEMALRNAIKGEAKTIEAYEKLITDLTEYNNSTSEICIQLLNKIIADEKIHLELFRKHLNRM